MLGDYFMLGNLVRHLPSLIRGNMILVCRVEKNDIDIWVVPPRLAHHPFHGQNHPIVFPQGILVIVYGKLNKEQIDLSSAEHICGQAKGSRGGTG